MNYPFDQTILKRRIIIRRIIQGMIVVGILVMAIASVNHENDIFWQLRMGEEIVKHHHFPTKDPYSLPAEGEVWTLEEWLPSTIFYIIFSNLGPTTLIIFKAIIISTTYFLFMILFNKMKVNLYLSTLVLLLAAMVNTRGVWTVFPSIFEYLFLVITLLVMEYYQQKRRLIYKLALFLLAIIWPQSHGSFFLLTAIAGFYLLGDILVSLIRNRWSFYQPLGARLSGKERQDLLQLFIWSIIAPFLTPNGYFLFIYPFRITFGKFTGYVSEYQKFWTVWNWNFNDFVHGFTLILIVITALLLLVSIKKLHPRDLFLAIFFTVLALSAVRHVAIFALVALFLIAKYLTLWFGEYRGFFKRTLVKDTLIVLLVLLFIFYYKTRFVSLGFDFLEDGYPREAAELINNSHIKGNMFNHYNFGGYLIWKMPEYKVFIDGRLEMYEGKAGEEYLTILYAKPGYKDLLEKYKINFFLVYITEPVVEKLINDENWRYVYSDEQFVVFVKNSPENASFLSKYWSWQKQANFKTQYQTSLIHTRVDDYNRRAYQELQNNNPIVALYYMQQAEILDPSSIPVRINLANLYTQMGILQEATREYQNILKLDANNLQAKKGLKNLERLSKLPQIY